MSDIERVVWTFLVNMGVVAGACLGIWAKDQP